jgi:acyl carrier protein
LQDSLERQLAEIWCAVLGLQHVEPTDRFFDLGGTSLMLMKVQAMIAEKLFPAIQQTVLFEAPTIRELAARLRQGGRIDVSGRAQNHAAALARARRMHPAQRGSHG